MQGSNKEEKEFLLRGAWLPEHPFDKIRKKKEVGQANKRRNPDNNAGQGRGR